MSVLPEPGRKQEASVEKYNRFAHSPASQVRKKSVKTARCGGAGGSRDKTCGEQCRTGHRVQLGACRAVKRGQGALPNPNSHSMAPDNEKQKEEQKTIQATVWFKEFISDKKFPTKKSYKKSRDKEWSLQKCSQIEKTHLSNPKARWHWLCTVRDCLSEGMQRSSAPKLCPGPPAVSGVSPWLLTTTSSSPFPPWFSPSEHRLLLCLHPTRVSDISRTPSPEGFIPTPHLPSAPLAATSLRLGLPLSSLATNPLRWYHSLRAGFSPILGEAPAHCAGLVLTLMNQLSCS